jgi:hypothetical protein
MNISLLPLERKARLFNRAFLWSSSPSLPHVRHVLPFGESFFSQYEVTRLAPFGHPGTSAKRSLLAQSERGAARPFPTLFCGRRLMGYGGELGHLKQRREPSIAFANNNSIVRTNQRRGKRSVEAVLAIMAHALPVVDVRPRRAPPIVRLGEYRWRETQRPDCCKNNKP